MLKKMNLQINPTTHGASTEFRQVCHMAQDSSTDHHETANLIAEICKCLPKGDISVV